MFFRALTGLVFITAFGSLAALEFGNPFLPQVPQQGIWTSADAWAGLKAGYVGEWIHDLKLEVKRPQKSFRQSVEQFETWSHLANIAVNLGQRFQFYGQVGAMKSNLRQEPIKGALIELETKSQFAGGVGARVVLIEWAYAAIGANANGLLSWMDADRIEQSGQMVGSGNAFVQYKNWQIGGNIGARWGFFLPYLGLAYQSATIKLKDLPNLVAYGFNSNPRKLKTRIHTVLFTGIGMTLERGFDLNLEVRMIGEVGGSIAADLRF